MDIWKNKTAVVTGASSGIGAAIVKDLVNAGMHVVGLARRKKLIEELSKSMPPEQQTRLTAIECDVSSLESVNRAFDEIIARYGGVDLLVNNAGVVKCGLLLKMEPQLVQDVLSTNVMGIVHCTRRAVESMQKHNVNGHVVLMSSTSAHEVFTGLPGEDPTFNIYSPTKFAINSMAEVYRKELRSLGSEIKITSISPGLVDTEMAVTFQERGLYGLRPEDVSKAVLYALSTPPNVEINDVIIKPLMIQNVPSS